MSFRGNLIIPPDARLIKAEPAIPMILKKRTRAEKIFKKNKNARRIYPGIPRKKKSTESYELYQEYLDHFFAYEFQEDGEVELLVIPSQDEFLQVAMVEFKWPEVAGEIRREGLMPTIKKIKQLGFVHRAHLDTHPNNYRYIKIPPDTPIFGDGNLALHQINQGQFANCYLLSAIGALLKTKEGCIFLKSIMRQQEDGTTIVKLFNPITHEYEYIQVENSYLYAGNHSEVQHLQPWIHILEKAYAVLASKADKLVVGQRQLFPSFFSIFTGDNPAHAMLILTGNKGDNQPAKEESFIHPLKAFFNESFLYLLRQKGEIKEEMPEAKEEEDSPEHGLLKKIFKTDEHIQLWLKIYEAFPLEFKTISRDLPSFFSTSSRKENFIKEADHFLEKLNRLMVENKPVVPAALIACFKDFLQDFGNKNYPEAQEYHRSLLKVYAGITKAIVENKLVTATTEKFRGNPENIGIVPDHAYTVLGTRQTEDKPPRCLIKLRNPWGRLGRGYDNKEGEWIAKAIQNPEFEIELADFSKYFLAYSIGEFSNIPALAIKVTRKDLSTLANKVQAVFQQVGIFKEDGKEYNVSETQFIKKFLHEFTVSLDGLEPYLDHILHLVAQDKNSQTFTPLQIAYSDLFTLLQRAQHTYQGIKQYALEEKFSAESLAEIAQKYIIQLELIHSISQKINQIIDSVYENKVESKNQVLEEKSIYSFYFTNQDLWKKHLGSSLALTFAKQLLVMPLEDFMAHFNPEKPKAEIVLSRWADEGILLGEQKVKDEKKKVNLPQHNIKILQSEAADKKLLSTCSDILFDYRCKGYALEDLIFFASANNREIIFFGKEIHGRTYFYVLDPLFSSRAKMNEGSMEVYSNLDSALKAVELRLQSKIEITVATSSGQFKKMEDYTKLTPFIEKALDEKMPLDKNYKYLCHTLYHLREKKLSDDQERLLFKRWQTISETYIHQMHAEIKRQAQEPAHVALSALKALEKQNKVFCIKLEEMLKTNATQILPEFLENIASLQNSVKQHEDLCQALIKHHQLQKMNTFEAEDTIRMQKILVDMLNNIFNIQEQGRDVAFIERGEEIIGKIIFLQDALLQGNIALPGILQHLQHELEHKGNNHLYFKALYVPLEKNLTAFKHPENQKFARDVLSALKYFPQNLNKEKILDKILKDIHLLSLKTGIKDTKIDFLHTLYIKLLHCNTKNSESCWQLQRECRQWLQHQEAKEFEKKLGQKKIGMIVAMFKQRTTSPSTPMANLLFEIITFLEKEYNASKNHKLALS